jgi:hypothetical protein
MRFLITFKLFETVTGTDIVRVQQEMGEQLQYTLGTGRVLANGTFTDTRGGFFLVDVNEEEDSLDLLGSAVLDNFMVESHPVVPFERVIEMQKKLYGRRI